MDPTACLNRLDEALNIGDRPKIHDAADDLLTWLSGGGFRPAFSNGDWRVRLTGLQMRGYLRDIIAATRERK